MTAKIMQAPILQNQIFNEDCIHGMKKLESEMIDEIITDPPFAIKFNGKQSNYNRDSDLVLEGYVEISQENYTQFSRDWIEQAYRILKDSGSMYVFSGYNNMRDILNALHDTGFHLIGNPIWKYNFGVYAEKKYVVSHYNIFYVCKNSKKIKFNSDCRFTDSKKRYNDLIDVWDIKRKYWTKKVKPPTKLPYEIVDKLMSYSSDVGDIILDPFLGSGQVAKVAKDKQRKYIGFEVVKNYFDFIMERLK